ncbi:MAG: hypothetical protein KAU94_02710 [Verrucomicrobia bacterium]|nr:hypothetical protein [Verrucomicrobiota bacterium]
MKRLMFLLLLSSMPLQAREVKEFDAGWRFTLGDPKGAFVEWYQENDGSPHKATLVIRYSGKKNGAKGRTMTIAVNGKSTNLFFPNTKAYGTDWKTIETEIKIGAGANTIRLTTLENGGMCIDEIEVR